MYTANIADTVIFRSLGKEPNPRLETLKQAVKEADTEIWVPPVVYHELSDASEADVPANPYLDTAIAEGWLRVAIPLAGDRGESFDRSANSVVKARTIADDFLMPEASTQRQTTGEMQLSLHWQYGSLKRTNASV